MCVFSKHCKSKIIIMFILYRGRSDPYEPVTTWNFNVDGQPKNNIELDEDDYLRNPTAQNKHVGVDEEPMYLETLPQNAVHVVNYQTQRYKGNGDKKWKGQHKCPICEDYGHHWHNCKRGRLENIEALKATG